MSKFFKSVSRAASSVVKAVGPAAKLAVSIVVTSILTHRTIKSLAVDAVKSLGGTIGASGDR